MAMNDKEVIVSRAVDSFVTSKILSATSRIIIMSPWISESTATMLLDKARQGVKVRLYTIDDMRNNANALYMLLEKKRIDVRLMNRALVKVGIAVITVFAAWLAVLFLALHSLVNEYSIIAGIVGLAVGAGLFVAGLLKKYYVWISRLGDGLRVYQNQEGSTIHAKVYIVDDWVGLGSVNFTFSGLKKNLESFIWINDKDLAEQVLKQLESALSREVMLTYDVVGKMAEGMKKERSIMRVYKPQAVKQN